MITPPPPRVRSLVGLAALRLRQVEGYNAAELYRDQPARVRRHLTRRVDRAMTPDWSAGESQADRFARFTALPSRLRIEAGRVRWVDPEPEPTPVVATTRRRTQAERFPRFFAGR